MTFQRKSAISIALAVIAGMASAMLSLWGLIVGLWGGFVDTNRPFTSILLWLLPLLCLPVFGLSILRKRIGLILLWILPVSVFLNLFVANYASCMEEECATMGSVHYALRALFVFGYFSILYWLPAICMQMRAVL